jgi:hypothetical protein
MSNPGPDFQGRTVSGVLRLLRRQGRMATCALCGVFLSAEERVVRYHAARWHAGAPAREIVPPLPQGGC